VIAGGSDVLILTRTAARRARVLNVLRESEAVVTVSEGLRQRVLALGASPERVHTIYQGIDASVFHPGDRRDARQQLGLSDHYRVLVWVGRMVPVKGLEVLIDAFTVAAGGCGSLHLYLLGDGPLVTPLRRCVEERHLMDRVHFVGPVPHHDLPTWYRAADGTVLSSWSEGLPNVLRESLACGTPFVATDVGSISEIADAAYSLLTPAGDVILLADAMRRITDERYRRGAEAYRARTWDDTARDFSDLLASLQHAPGAERRTIVSETSEDGALQAGFPEEALIPAGAGAAEQPR
ncbi:MAG: glycosyltransferase family 4 protein, partial [Planctomycetes bacterium]|nr:glycosyltransferase family 4 protein [Planctomycetota bacterium]